MIGRVLPTKALPKTRIPITFEDNRQLVFQSWKILPVFEEPSTVYEQLDFKEKETEAGSDVTEVHIWNRHNIWYLNMTSDKRRQTTLRFETTKYRSFLGMIWLASIHFSENVQIYTTLAAHIKCFCTGMAPI